MEAYPEDLITGVFPLVFVVNTIVADKSKNIEEEDDDESKDIEEDDEGDAGNNTKKVDSVFSKRSIFERFLDTMASNLVDGDNESVDSKRPSMKRNRSDFVSMLRGNDNSFVGDDISDEEDFAMDNSSHRIRMGSSSRNARPTQISTAYANSLKLDGFFERARLVPISMKHGFPPSKDSTGQDNRSLKLSHATSALTSNPTNANALRLKRVMDRHPIEGIIPTGWLAKHVHALPSALLVVTSFQIIDREAQEMQDESLIEAMENVRAGLAAKRECSIRVVCLADVPDKPSTQTKLEEWINYIREECDLENVITILKTSHDLNRANGGLGNTSATVQKLHKDIREASWAYYLSLARHNKQKLSLLGYNNQPTLLPLAVRYCFKIGLFYEFLLRHSKALKFFSDAYRYLRDYYRHLLGKNNPDWNPTVAKTNILNAQGDDGAVETTSSELALDQHQRAVSDSGGVEAASEDKEKSNNISTSIPLDVHRIFTEIDPPFDMANQCRAVADWINFKIIQAGLKSASFSESDLGIIAASTQYRQHCQVFLKRDDPKDPLWSFWSYVAQQRLSISQLVERFHPRNLTTLKGLARDEVLMRFSSWRNYAAAAEAKLRVGIEIRKNNPRTNSFSLMSIPESIPTESLRKPFVGALDSEGFAPLLKEESQEDHTYTALDMLDKAISRFEAELEKHGQDGPESLISESLHRSGARIYYLAGGVLFGRKQHREAITYLERALKYVKGWQGLELAIRRMLIECYEKYLPSQDSTTKEQSSTIASMILDSYFNSKMSSRNLRKALDSFSSLTSDNGLMKWHRECIDESSSSLPFSFAVTFPGTTHVTAGDTATASVLIKSNLDYAVHINSVTLLSMAGELEVQSMSLLSAQNANEGNNGGIIVQAKTSILFTTPIEIPKDLTKIISDESGNGGEKEGIAGKGSFAKSARPRSAGLTSGAGARLLSEDKFDKSLQDKNSQWSMRYLGGKTFRCDGIRLLFYPVHVEKAASDRSTKVNIIELTIEKKKQRTAANIKRTPFEEDNYITSAWSRPNHLPLARGPRCLRILGPMPHMIITSVTDPLIEGKTIEGTVNRMLIKLQAGKTEICEDIKYNLSCSSMLLCLDGSTKHLNEDLIEKNLNTKEVEKFRNPCLVYHEKKSVATFATNFGYSLPQGYVSVGSGRRTIMEKAPPISTLKAGEETYIYFDIYRPSKADLLEDNANARYGEREQLCQTDFDISVTYKQTRPKMQHNAGRGRRRRKPMIDALEEDNHDPDTSKDLDLVSLEYTGSVLWTSPLSAEFHKVDESQKAPPAGSRHPSNSTQSEMKMKSEVTDEEIGEIALIDGERISTKCILSSNKIPRNVDIEVSRVWLEQFGDQKCRFCSVEEDDSSHVFFEADENDICRILGKEKKTSIILSTIVRMNDLNRGGSTSTRMGVVCVDWSPKSLKVPSAAADCLDVREHGPLSLSNHSTNKFVGPKCFVETSPFGTTALIEPTSPRVGAPFEVTFRIENKTNIYQTVYVVVKDFVEDRREDVLISGATKSELHISPNASQILSYTGIAIKPGKLSLPSISISSTRYRTWIVSSSGSPAIYVLP